MPSPGICPCWNFTTISLLLAPWVHTSPSLVDPPSCTSHLISFFLSLNSLPLVWRWLGAAHLATCDIFPDPTKSSPVAAPVHLPCDRHCRSPPVTANAPAAQQATHPFPSLQLESVSLPRTYGISHITSPIHSRDRWHRLLTSTEVRKGRSHVTSVDVDAHAGELLKIVSCESVAEAAILEDGFEARPAQLLVLSHFPSTTRWDNLREYQLTDTTNFGRICQKRTAVVPNTLSFLSIGSVISLWHIFAFPLLSLMSLQVAYSLYPSCHLDLLTPCCLLWHFISSLVLGSSLPFTSSQRRRSSCTTGHSTSIPWWHLRFSLRTLPPRMLTPSVFLPLIRVLLRRLTRRWLERWLTLIWHEVTILHLSPLCLLFQSSRWASSWHQQSTDRRWPSLSHDRSHTQCPFHTRSCRPSIAAFTISCVGPWPRASGAHWQWRRCICLATASCFARPLIPLSKPASFVKSTSLWWSFPSVGAWSPLSPWQKRNSASSVVFRHKKLDWFKPRRFYPIIKIAAVGANIIPYEKCFCPDPLFQLLQALSDFRRAHILSHMRFPAFFGAVFDPMWTNSLFLSPVFFFVGLLQSTFQRDQTLQHPKNRN